MSESERNASSQVLSHPESADGLEIDGVSKSFDNVDALVDVSLTVQPGEVVGLVGENGAGKSTLLKILTGIHRPDEGELRLHGSPVTVAGPRDAASKGISLVHQEQDVVPNMSGAENLYLGLLDAFSTAGVFDRSALEAAGNDVLDDLGIDLDLSERVANYSFNDRQLLEIAKAFSYLEGVDHPLILLDEPTAGLEEEGRNVLFDRVNELRDSASFVFVSHELDEVLDVTDRIYVLKDGRVVEETPTDEATEESLHRAMVGRETTDEYYLTSKQRPVPADALTALAAENIGTDDGLADISFELREGEILGVVGVDGSGKERLGRLLGGPALPDRGRVLVEGTEIATPTVPNLVNAGVGYVPKERKSEGLLLYQPLRTNVSLPSLGLSTLHETLPIVGDRLPLVDFERQRAIASRAIDELNIKTPGVDTLVHQLSGGNQQKVVLGKWVVRDTTVLVLDNVTRGIDVGAKEEVYRLCRDLADEEVAILFIGDELPEVIGLSNRILVMKKGRIVETIEAPADEKPDEETLIQEMI